MGTGRIKISLVIVIISELVINLSSLKSRDMLKLHIPELWPSEFSDRVDIIYAISRFNSVFEESVNNIGNLVDVRISFPSLDSESQCVSIREHVRERGDIILSQISPFTDNAGVSRFRLTLEYSAELIWKLEV